MAEYRQYLKYLEKHPSYLDLCYLAKSSHRSGLTASEASKTLGLSIQTVTNALRDLRTAEILRDRKEGRERRYQPTDYFSLSKALREVPRMIGREKIKSRLFTIQTLREQVSQELRRLIQKHKKGLSLVEDRDIRTLLVDMRVDFQLLKNQIPVNTIILCRVNDTASMLTALGKICLIAGKSELFGSLVVVLLMNLYTLEPLAPLVQKLIGGKLLVMEDRVDDLEMLIPDYGTQLADKIFGALFA